MPQEGNMTRTDVIQEIADRTDISQSDIKEVFDEFSDVLGENLEDGVDVRMHKIGAFHVKELQPRNFHNPQNGEVIRKGVRRKVKFRPYSHIELG